MNKQSLEDMKLKELKDMTLTQIWDKFKKPFNFAWKAGIIFMAICIACGLFSELMGWLWCYVEGDSYDTEYVSDKIEVRYYTDGTCRIFTRWDNKKLSNKLKFVDSYPNAGDTLTTYQSLDGKWGYLSTVSGKIVIPAAYAEVWDFSEGLAAVVDDIGKVGFINRTGEIVFYVEDVCPDGSDNSFSNGVCVMESATNGFKGAINRSGEWILPMEYSQVFSPYRNGYVKVSDGEKWGLYDSSGQEVFPIEYDDIYYDEGYDRVFTNKNGLKQLVSVTGEVIEPFIIDRVAPLNYIVEYNPDSTNFVATHPYLVEYEIDSERGVLDSRSSKIIIPAIYNEIEMISKSTIRASLDNEHIESVIFDTQGNKLP